MVDPIRAKEMQDDLNARHKRRNQEYFIKYGPEAYLELLRKRGKALNDQDPSGL